MPELPEVENARQTIQTAALGRRIADVDDADSWECRPRRRPTAAVRQATPRPRPTRPAAARAGTRRRGDRPGRVPLRIGRGHAPVKARLLDQSVVAGIGNLLADETLRQARISPRRPCDELGVDELSELRRALRRAIRSAIRHGGVHIGTIVPFRAAGRHCPALRSRAGPRHRRRADHLVVSGRATLKRGPQAPPASPR
ncbi:MAG TPA: hypothetical protein VFP34_05500 [Microlunatus sp.]|nr:hypothetical protein [Microlunatus sp.]